MRFGYSKVAGIGLFFSTLIQLRRIYSTVSDPTVELIVVGSDAVHTDWIELQIKVSLNDDDSFLPESAYICIAKKNNQIVTNEALYQSGEGLCAQRSDFKIQGLKSGTHLMLGYITPRTELGLLYTTEFLLDVVNSARVQELLPYDHAQFCLNAESIYSSRYDHILWSILDEDNDAPKPIMMKHATKCHVLSPEIVPKIHHHDIPNHEWGKAQWQQSNTTTNTIRLVFFLHDLSTVEHASDRSKDWICNAQYFADRGIAVSILTGTGTDTGTATGMPDVTHVCGQTNVVIHRFEILSASKAALYLENANGEAGDELHNSLMAPLITYLESEVDALVTTNTFGDVATSVILTAVLQLQDQEPVVDATQQQTQSVRRRRRRRPLVLMDLPNLGLIKAWDDVARLVIDAFIAPSRAVGLHISTRKYEKPVAMIYPPIREISVQSSPCLQQTPISLPPHMQAHEHEHKHEYDYGAITWPRRKSSNDSIRFRFLFVGRLAQEKCPGLLIHAIAHMVNENALLHRSASTGTGSLRHEVHVTIVGGGLLEEALQDMASRLNVSDMITFAGAKTAAEVVSYMQQADILVNPRIEGETFGIIHSEAALQGLPVVAFDVNANRESILFGALIPYRIGSNVADLSGAMLQVYTQRDEYAKQFTMRKMCDSSLRMLQKWNLERHNQALIDTITRLGITAMIHPARVDTETKAVLAAVEAGIASSSASAAEVEVALASQQAALLPCVELMIETPRMDAVIYSNSIEWKVSVSVNCDAFVSPAYTSVCISVRKRVDETASELLQRDRRSCVQKSRFFVDEFNLGTHMIAVFVLGYVDEEAVRSDSFDVLASKEILVHIAYDERVQTRIHYQQQDVYRECFLDKITTRTGSTTNTEHEVISQFDYVLAYPSAAVGSNNTQSIKCTALPMTIFTTTAASAAAAAVDGDSTSPSIGVSSILGAPINPESFAATTTTTTTTTLTDAYPDAHAINAAPTDTGVDSREVGIAQSYRLAFFLHDLSTVEHASDRGKDWICNAQYFADRGITVSILTGTDTDTGTDTGMPDVTLVCGQTNVVIHRFEILSASKAALYLENGNSSHSGAYGALDDKLVAPLLSFLESDVDALMTTNTFGDISTTLLLNLLSRMENRSDHVVTGEPYHTSNSHHPPAGDRTKHPKHREQQKQEQEQERKQDRKQERRRRRRRRRPLVLMDLPNLGLIKAWDDVASLVIDAFIAPSRAVGLHISTRKYEKPVAMIYPPIREISVQSSPCLQQTPISLQPHMQAHEHKHEYDYGAITWPRRKANNDSIRFRFLFVGRLAQEKCPGLLIHAIAHMVNENALLHRPASTGTGTGSLRHEVHLTIVGGGLLEEALQDMARRLNVSDMITFAGAKTAAEVVSYMQQADILVNPRIEGETFGIIHSEAALQGLPVVAFDVNANRESILFGALIPYRIGSNVADLSGAMLQVYTQQDEYAKQFTLENMCSHCKTMWEKWNMERHTQALLNLIIPLL